MSHHPVIVVGAGPAGLTAAYELVKRRITPILLEKSNNVGGLARTEVYEGYHFDIGGHRFYTKADEVQQLWKDMLGEDFLQVPRLSRIYYQGQFFNYPLDFRNALSNLGIAESLLILASFFKAQLWPYLKEETLEQWVINRFGRRLYETFFKTYTEKVWGIPCHKIQADWATQRIKGLSLTAAASNAFFGNNHVKSLITEFHYPVLGPGMMWRQFRDAVESQSGRIHLDSEVTRFGREGHRITSVTARCGGKIVEFSAEHYISSIPLTELILRLDPPPPPDVLGAACNLYYRAFVLVGLVVDREQLFPDQWIYVHSPGVKVGRIQNFKNWSAAMVPDSSKTSLGMEYFCSEGDDMWRMADAELIELATRELVSLGLAVTNEVEHGVVFRQPKAYPVYDQAYRTHLKAIRRFLETVDNLQTIGRNGMHRYNNMDHSMLMGMLAVENILGERHNLWQVNEEQEYLEARHAAAVK